MIAGFLHVRPQLISLQVVITISDQLSCTSQYGFTFKFSVCVLLSRNLIVKLYICSLFIITGEVGKVFGRYCTVEVCAKKRVTIRRHKALRAINDLSLSCLKRVAKEYFEQLNVNSTRPTNNAVLNMTCMRPLMCCIDIYVGRMY